MIRKPAAVPDTVPRVFEMYIILDVLAFLKVVHEDIRAVLHTKFGGVEDHMVIIYVAPCLSSMVIIIRSAFLVVCLHLFFRLVIGQAIFPP